MEKNSLYYRFIRPTTIPGYDGEASIDPTIANFINTSITGALNSFRTKDLPTIVKDTVTSAVSGAISPVTDSLTQVNLALEALKTSRTSQGDGGNGSGGNSSGAAAIPPEVNAQMKRLEESLKVQGSTIEQLKKEKLDADVRAEKAERHSLIRNAMNEIPFADMKAAETAFMLVEPRIKRSDEGVVIAEGNLPLKDFIEDFVKNEHSYLLRATGTSGSGATSGGVARGGSGGARADINDIKQGMTAESRQKVLNDIGAALPMSGSRRY